jgi:hypothetical protein
VIMIKWQGWRKGTQLRLASAAFIVSATPVLEVAH